MAKDKIKKVTINNQEFQITRFGYWDGLDVRLELIKLLAPSLGAFVGKGFSELKNTESSEEIKKLDTKTLISKLDENILEKVGKALSENIQTNTVKALYEKALGVVLYKRGTLTDQITALVSEDVISYGDVDKLVMEVISHQGFFGNLLSEVHAKMRA